MSELMPLSPAGGGAPDPLTFPTAGPAGPAPGVTCDGIEVVQAVQSLPAHDVPLVAGKATVVRAYLSTDSPAPITVRGTLTGRPAVGPARDVASANTVTIQPAENGVLRLKREALDKGLYFVLPPDMTTAGSWEFELTAVEQSDPAVPLTPPTGAARTVQFLTTPPLRVHVVGIRFRTPSPAPQTLTPRPLDFALLRSWLGRAYPVPEVIWSAVTVDFPTAWPFDSDDVNAYLRTLRGSDVTAGTDERTHYYGLVFEGSAGAFFMRGSASAIPTAADPSAVASGPTGGTRWTNWDTDGSYGDWYGGHELAHTFGRRHPGFCAGNSASDPSYPYPNGQISPNDGSHVGLDFGDPANALPMQALPGVMWKDVMTYCNFQWVSQYTYTGVRDRLLAEDALGLGAPGPAAVPAGGAGMPAVHVVATINRTKSTGRIVSVVPSAAAATAKPAGPNSVVVLRVNDAAGQALGTYDAPWIPNACRDQGSDDTGMTDALIPNHATADAIDLVVGGQTLATFRRGIRPVPVRNLDAAAPPALGPAAGAVPPDPVVTWVDDAAALAGPGPGGTAPTYLVAVSTDDGRTWRTVGANLTTPSVTLDRNLLLGAIDIRVCVTGTDGFSSESSTKTFRAADL